MKQTLLERIYDVGIEGRSGDVSVMRGVQVDVQELIDCLEGCLHFDDAFIQPSVLGDALRGWRFQSAEILKKVKGV